MDISAVNKLIQNDWVLLPKSSNITNKNKLHWVKNVRIWIFSGPYFPAFELSTERYGVSLCIQSKCGKIRTRKTSNTDTPRMVHELEPKKLGIWLRRVNKT